MKDIVDFIKGFDYHTIIIVAVAFWWFNGQIKQDLKVIETEIALIKRDVSELTKEVAVIKAVLIMKNVMPAEMAVLQPIE